MYVYKYRHSEFLKGLNSPKLHCAEYQKLCHKNAV